MDVRLIGRELSVRYVLQGSVRKITDSLRINAQLVEAANASQLWAERFDGQIAQLAKVQGDVTQRIAGALNVALIDAESQRALRERPNNPDVVDLTLRGWALLNKPASRESMQRARKQFDEALRLSPDHLPALNGLANVMLIEWGSTWYGGSSEEHLEALDRVVSLGWIEGRTVAIEYRWAEGRRERFSEIAAEFVGLKVDVIVTGGDAAGAAKQVTSVIPIVFALGLDPLGSGLVANLARPGGNVTGLSFQSIDIAGKRVELLHEIVPHLRRLAILVNVGNPQSVLEMGAAQAAARMLGLEIATFEFRRSGDIVPSFDALNGRVDAIYVCGDALVYINRNRINTLSVGLRLPTVHLAREFIEAGGLMSYGPSMQAQFRRAAEFVDKILRGAKPADLSVEQPTKFELVINLTTAKAIGLEIPPALLARADEVIE
jgi:putative tryptophan/tyrosine transport system substrate-binding protein